MCVRAVGPEFNQFAASGTGLIVAIILIASLPFLLGLAVLLPGWLESLGIFAVQVPAF